MPIVATPLMGHTLARGRAGRGVCTAHIPLNEVEADITEAFWGYRANASRNQNASRWRGNFERLEI